MDLCLVDIEVVDAYYVVVVEAYYVVLLLLSHINLFHNFWHDINKLVP